LKIKIKGCHFDTIGVIEAESQAVLNTLTEHDFQDAFVKWEKRWERCIRAEVTTSRVMVTSRLKEATAVPEIMDIPLWFSESTVC
jgi:hypothetical protein